MTVQSLESREGGVAQVGEPSPLPPATNKRKILA
jgi:hypothetical protein